MTPVETKILELFADGREHTESGLKVLLTDSTEERWLRSILVKLYMKRLVCRVKRYNPNKHCAEWIYTLPKSI